MGQRETGAIKSDVSLVSETVPGSKQNKDFCVSAGFQDLPSLDLFFV